MLFSKTKYERAGLKNKFAFSDHSFTPLAAASKMAGFDVSWTKKCFVTLTLIFVQFWTMWRYWVVNKICFWNEKWGSQNVQYWSLYYSMHDMACEICVRSKDAQEPGTISANVLKSSTS